MELFEMLAFASAVSVLLGGTMACCAERYPAYTEALETAAGVLLIGGLGLIGSALPLGT